MDILFITHNRLGDAVLSTGLLGHLIDRFPEARLTVACGPVPAPLLALAPNVEELLVMEKRPLAGHWWRLWRSVAGRRWDLVVDLRGSAIAWLLRAGERRVLRPDGDRQHRVRHLAGVLDLTPPPVPRLWLRPEHAVAAAELIPEGPPVLAIGPTANWGGKQWPADRFAELARRLTHGGGIMAGARIAVFGAPDERPAAAATLAGLPAERRLDLLGRVDLPTLHGCLGRCQFFVGNDSGLMHMAAAA
ncbi:MAG: glycosyltransferase family 9 protein, partial [Alphaproteobacteria bacterium]|nr:glycosyltransferase family 9 protein [Alphaproteobacteria bacterium]